MSVSRGEREALIALSGIPGLGPARIRALVREFGSASAIFRATPGRLVRVRGIGPKIAEQIGSIEPARVARNQMERALRNGAQCLHPDHARFPPLLREIYDPPPVLWSRGVNDIEFRKVIAIVGSRRPTAMGRAYAHDLAYEMTKRGWTVVSGLACGIDAQAHRGALDAGGSTVAVLGCGVDVVYPVANRSLYGRIKDRGVLLSEFPMGARPDATNFPRRNRLISGMSRGVVVVEAFKTGGGLITARFALDQNREVFAVPGSPSAPASAGCNRLIQSGEAKLILSADDIESEFGMAPERDDEAREAFRPAVHCAERDPVLECLSVDPVHIDTICERTGLSSAVVQSRLLILEIDGLVTQLPGKRFYLAG